MNFADVAAYSGVAMMIRSLALLSRAIGAERTVRPGLMRHEVEIGIPVAVERGTNLPRSRPSDRERPNGLSIDFPATDRLDHSR